MYELDVRLHVGQGTHRRPVTVFPVWTDAPSSVPDYLTGADAPVDVEERAGSPAVDQLVVTNRSQRPVLLLAGELLEGGWQTRALTAATVLAPGQPTVHQVVCVEEGRWGGDVAHSRQGRRVPFAVRARFDRPDAQQAVWDRVRRYEAVAGPSETGSLADRLDRTAPTARDLTRGLRPLAGQRGILVGIAGRPAWLELFDSRRSLAAHWSGLMHAATLDALGQSAVRTPAALARSFAERIERTRLTSDGPAGLGRRFRGGGRVRVNDVRWNDRTVISPPSFRRPECPSACTAPTASPAHLSARPSAMPWAPRSSSARPGSSHPGSPPPPGASGRRCAVAARSAGSRVSSPMTRRWRCWPPSRWSSAAASTRPTSSTGSAPG
jgi:hypothetical protein